MQKSVHPEVVYKNLFCKILQNSGKNICNEVAFLVELQAQASPCIQIELSNWTWKFKFSINWTTKFKILYLFSFLTQIMKIEIQNIASFFMLNVYLLWISIFAFNFSFSQKNQKRNTVHGVRFSFSWEKWKRNTTKYVRQSIQELTK